MIPSKFSRFLNAGDAQLYLYEGTVIIFDERELFKARYSRNKINAFIAKFERDRIKLLNNNSLAVRQRR